MQFVEFFLHALTIRRGDALLSLFEEHVKAAKVAHRKRWASSRTRLLDVGENRGQGGTNLVDVVVDGSTGQGFSFRAMVPTA